MSQNEIHATCIIGENVKMGVGNQILPNTIILGPTTIGDNNIIGPNVVIGSPGQDSRNPRYDSSACVIEIGNNNIIREFSAVQKPCYREITKIGNDNFLMQGIHVPHDAILHDKLTIAPMTVFGGIVNILTGANIGIGVSVHQFSVIGQYCMVAMGAVVTKNIKPFGTFIPNKKLKVNHYAIKKYGFEAFTEEIENYIFQDILPKSEEIGSIVEIYERIHTDSHRPGY